MKRSVVLSGVALSTTMLLLAACGSSGNKSSSTNGGSSKKTATVNVGVVDDLTGVASFCGTDEVKGMQLAVNQANSSGELHGLKINLDIKDDASTAAQGVVAFHSLVDSKVSAILGSCVSTVDQALSPIANSTQTPEIMTVGDDPAYTSTPYVYGGAINAQDYVANAVPVLASKGVKSIAIIYESNVPSTVNDYNYQKAALQKAGINILKAFPTASTTTDFSPEISEIKALHPDAIGVLFVGTPNVTIVTQLRQEGMNQPVLGQVVMQTPFYIADAKSAADGSIFSTDYAPTFPYASSKAFTSAFEAAYHTTPYYASASGYDAAEFLIQALKVATSTDAAGVKAALDSVKSFDGAQGPLTVNSDGVVQGPAGTVEIVNGQLNYLPASGS